MSSGTFAGGIHPPDYKEATAQLAIEYVPLAKELFVPLHQHIGAPCAPCVEVGQEVLKGQKLGDTEAFVSAPVRAPATGKVVAIEKRKSFTGLDVLGVVIAVGSEEDQQRRAYLDPILNWQEADVAVIRKQVREAGLVGMGGAAFPTSVKLSPPADSPIDTVIINACECEPFLTCDHRLMLERAEDMIVGALIMKRVVNAQNVIIGIEDNKPDAIAHVTQVAAKFPGVRVVGLHTKYPQGAEKQLIKATLDREVPARGLPMKVGALVHNVSTAISMADAVLQGKPLLDRVVTISGPGIKRPCNVRVAFGTPFAHLVEYAGGLNGLAARIVIGGPMTGFAQSDLSATVVKGTGGLLALDKTMAARREEYRDCVRCQRCVRACPMYLYPNFLATAAELSQWDKADKDGALDCVECGACAYECPSNRPMVRFIRSAKATIVARQRA
jgi:Na+-translocating ferredoxin:NAD+ oxidoreductase subunit C